MRVCVCDIEGGRRGRLRCGVWVVEGPGALLPLRGVRRRRTVQPCMQGSRNAVLQGRERETASARVEGAHGGGRTLRELARVGRRISPGRRDGERSRPTMGRRRKPRRLWSRPELHAKGEGGHRSGRAQGRRHACLPDRCCTLSRLAAPPNAVDGSASSQETAVETALEYVTDGFRRRPGCERGLVFRCAAWTRWCVGVLYRRAGV